MIAAWLIILCFSLVRTSAKKLGRCFSRIIPLSSIERNKLSYGGNIKIFFDENWKVFAKIKRKILDFIFHFYFNYICVFCF